MRYFLEISYNGKNFHGWQIQPNAVSVQEILNKSLSTVLRQKIITVGAGRTDTGVHAKQMFCHFDTEKVLDIQFIHKMNAILPLDILVKDIFRVKDNANSRFDAQSREYKYYITEYKDPFFQDFSYHFYRKLDLKKMNNACKILKKYKDFKCFSKSGTQISNYICDVKYAKWEKKGELIIFTVRADRFLRNMVRAIVGTMIDIGTNKIDLNDFEEIIRLKNRSNAGFSVPAKGLFLYEVKYPEYIKIE